MNMLEIHKDSRENRVLVCIHEFKQQFKKNSNVVYGFVEGKDDPCYYRGMLDNKLPHEWENILWIANGKDNVLEIYSKLDWRTYKKNQVLFFVDRDLSLFTGEQIPVRRNIYTTDNYSIENDVVNRNTCKRILTELLGFHAIYHSEKEKIFNFFEEQLEIFFQKMIPIMAWIIYWRRSRNNVCLNDIRMKDLFRVKKGKITPIAKPKRKNSFIEYIHGQCNIKIDSSYNATRAEAEFSSDNKHKQFTRGKYLLWFLIKFCLSIHKDCTSMSLLSIDTQPKNTVNLSHSNGMALIAPRCRAPESLNTFLEKTICHYVKRNKMT